MLRTIIRKIHAPCCAYVCLVLCSLQVLLAGCHSVRPPVHAEYRDGARIEALSSAVSLSHAASSGSISGNGLLMYRNPDQIRVVVLSPFGSVLQEVYVSGNAVTILDTGNGAAFVGLLSDLPHTGDLSGWRHIHWLVDIDVPDREKADGTFERVNRFGDRETARFDNGFLMEKTLPTVGRVMYSGYSAVQGVAVPEKITFETLTRERFTVTLEEPEVNSGVNEISFVPDLTKFRTYPLFLLRSQEQR